MPRSGAIQIDADLNVGSVYLDAKAQQELDGITKKLNNLAKRHGFGNIEKMVGAARGAGFSPAMAITYTRRQLENVRGQRLDLGQVAGLQYIATKMYNKEKNDIAANKAQIREAKRIEAEEQKNMAAEADHAKLLQFGSLTQIRNKIADYKIGRDIALKHGWGENDEYIKGIDKMVEELEEVASVLEQETDAVTQSSNAAKHVAGAMMFVGRMLDGMWDNGTPITNLYEKGRSSLPLLGGTIGAFFGPLGMAIGAGAGQLLSGIIDAVHGAWRQTTERALRMRNRWAVLGGQWNHNYAENLGAYGINENSLATMTNHARFFKVDAAYGQINENQFLGHSILRNYHEAVMRGENNAGLVDALRRDYAELGDQHFHRGLMFAGLPEDLMQLNTLTDKDWGKVLDGRSTMEQEVIDISHNVATIADWAQRNINELNAVRSGANATYANQDTRTWSEQVMDAMRPGSMEDRAAAFTNFLKSDPNTEEGKKAFLAFQEHLKHPFDTRPLEVHTTNVVNVDGNEVSRTTHVTKELLEITQSMVM